MGKRGPKSKFKTQREKKAAHKESNRKWYKNNARNHIQNVTARRRGIQDGRHLISTPEKDIDEVVQSTDQPFEDGDSAIDSFEDIVRELRALNKRYNETLGWPDTLGLGRNWVAQLNAAIFPEDEAILLHRAEHLCEVCHSMAARIGYMTPALLKHAIELLDEEEEIERKVLQGIYFFREIVTYLQIGKDSYIEAARKGILFWQKDLDPMTPT
ncbi:hypothetical protein M422DRAFT_267624 [Sphaerobolus stellatus SS14]|uniref:Uncharacterized protein n=1 Tax=Sphaerobolus stellatus (strain SS14) TaxID=990650 RepID=A0A0C9V041_SPHS4|nr:hypothetical protein M422DRAFT_267624 [Sphaerobolus stellatus SS14]